MDTAIVSPCLYYWTLIDESGCPILGSMHAKPTNKFDKDYTPCNEARVPPFQMTAPSGQIQCFPPSGLRFWYQYNSRTKQIVPNSMISLKGQPNRSRCTGTSTWLEFKLFTH